MSKSGLLFFLFKTLVSGGIIALISTIAKHYPKAAALLTALPLMTFLSLIWIYWEHRDLDMLARYTWDVFIWVLPSLVFFLVAFWLFQKHVPFLWSLSLSTLSLFLGVLLFGKWGFLK